jgi:ribosome biogenesis GTPase
MALIRKRRLTDQQNRRIEAQQSRKQKEPTLDDQSQTLEGLIVAHYGRQIEVQALTAPSLTDQPAPIVADGEPIPFWRPVQTGEIWRCHSRTNLPVLVTGDRVRWQADSNTGLGIITAVHDRTSLLTRPDRYHKVKPVAANVSLIVVVFAPLPVPSTQLIDRYLVACEQANIKALLVMGKADLLTADDPLHGLLAEYQALGYDTLTVQTDGDLSELRTRMDGETVVFVGQSGVGKSSLINILLPEAMQRVNIISENSALGQHTTTTTRLMPFDAQDLSKGVLIDSPGIREFGVWHLSVDAIRAGFIEMQPYYGGCKFRNCLHRNEPQCALIAASQRGEVLPRRLISLNRLEDEARDAEKNS